MILSRPANMTTRILWKILVLAVLVSVCRTEGLPLNSEHSNNPDVNVEEGDIERLYADLQKAAAQHHRLKVQARNDEKVSANQKEGSHALKKPVINKEVDLQVRDDASPTQKPTSAPNTTTPPPGDPKSQPQVAPNPQDLNYQGNSLFIGLVAACSVAGLVGLVVAGVCWYRLQKNVKAASEAEYPAYGVTGPNKERVQSPGDRKLAQSAQMYHYQHQKQQMIALEKANGEMKHDASDEDSDEENEEGDYTVYECPGLAPTGEMEVKNPLFSDETPVSPGPNDKKPEK